MSNQAYIDKKKAHLEHITAAFHGLNEKYHLLEPMLFDKKLVKEHNNYGFSVIRQSLFFNCIIDIVNIMKKNKKVSSIEEISNIFDCKTTIKKLHDDIVYSDAFEGIEHLEKSTSEGFSRNIEETKNLINNFLKLDLYKSFLVIRDKRIAHLELKCNNGNYELLDIATLNINWSDLKLIIDKLEVIIRNLNIILTGVNIADRSVFIKKMTDEYWYSK